MTPQNVDDVESDPSKAREGEDRGQDVAIEPARKQPGEAACFHIIYNARLDHLGIAGIHRQVWCRPSVVADTGVVSSRPRTNTLRQLLLQSEEVLLLGPNSREEDHEGNNRGWRGSNEASGNLHTHNPRQAPAVVRGEVTIFCCTLTILMYM